MEVVTINDLEQAINRARQSAPASGAESALSRDVSLLADLYGELIFRNHKAFQANSVDDKHQAALSRWLPDTSARAA